MLTVKTATITADCHKYQKCNDVLGCQMKVCKNEIKQNHLTALHQETKQQIFFYGSLVFSCLIVVFRIACTITLAGAVTVVFCRFLCHGKTPFVIDKVIIMGMKGILLFLDSDVEIRDAGCIFCIKGNKNSICVPQ